jgi:peptidoglycan/LPS O-acetylase OafA/YrhL
VATARISDIEILRAVAVLSVMAHHAKDNLFTWPSLKLQAFFERFELWWGVDLFLVISGFVIARDLLPRLRAAGGFKQAQPIVLSFWLRRAFRLLPSAWLWLGLILLGCLYLNQSGAFGTLQANLAATLAGVLQFANFRFADSFFRYEYGASFVYWSLALEEQFYLLLPLIVLLARRWIVPVLVLVIVVQFFTWRTPLLMVIRTDALAWGVLLAIFSQTPWYQQLQPKFLARGYWGLGVFAGLLLGLMLVSTEAFLWSFWRLGVIALLSAVLVWLASYDGNYFSIYGPLRKAMIWVGGRSYAIYLIHIPAFFVAREIWFHLEGPGPWNSSMALPLLCTAVPLIFILAELNYRWVENPLRRLGARLAERFASSGRHGLNH